MTAEPTTTEAEAAAATAPRSGGTAPAAGASGEVRRLTRSLAWQAWWAILWRDVFVNGKHLWVLLTQVAIAPLFILFVFAKVLGTTGMVNQAYQDTLLPGIIALSAFTAGLQSMALPLMAEFGWLREIDDRLLAPLPNIAVGIAKLVVSTIQGVTSAIIMYPISALLMGGAPWRPSGLPLLFVMLVLGSWVGGAVGVTIGTFVPVTRINIMFGLFITPLIFTGAVQYPWLSLANLRWFQIITAANPLTYCAEGVRAAIVPEVPHLAPWISVLAMVGFGLLFSAIGMIGFRRRSWA
jgi:ABC-2 type transport system permease protein